MPDLPAPRRVHLAPQRDSAGREEPPLSLSIYDAGTGPAVVLCHGFPELAYSWRYQLGPLREAGFRAIAPDMRGYGESDCPEGIETYDIRHLTGDLVALLDALEIDRAVFVGHDWGGFVAWAMPILHPERCAGVVGVNTPYLPRTPLPPTQLMRAMTGGDDEKLYILWFQEPGVAERVLDREPRRVFERLMRRPAPPEEVQARMASGELDMNPFRRLDELPALGEPLLSEDELEVYTAAFARTGFRGGVSWYRNFDRNWELEPEVGVAKIQVPCLMVSAERDLALPPSMADGMEARAPDLESHVIPDCGHWTQQECPEQLNRLMLDWLTRRFGAGAT